MRLPPRRCGAGFAFKAAEAARRQDRFDPFHANLLAARHQGRLDIDDGRWSSRSQEESGLELERFRRDLDDPAILDGSLAITSTQLRSRRVRDSNLRVRQWSLSVHSARGGAHRRRRLAAV